MQYLDDFLEYLKVIKKHSKNTIISYKSDILEFSKFMNNNLLNISKNDVFNYLNSLYTLNIAKSSISRKLSSLRMFYNYLYKLNIIETNCFLLIGNPKKEMSLPKYIKEDNIDSMFKIPDTRTPYGQRNLLIMQMLYATGLRVSELINIQLKDLNISDRTIKIIGKGSKERIVVFGVHTKKALTDYLTSGRKILNSKESEYLFLNKDGNKLSTRYIRIILNNVIKKTSLDISVSPHMLRHTFATNMLNNGADLVSVRDLLGHESLDTTSIYTHVSDDLIKEVYNLAHPRAHKK